MISLLRILAALAMVYNAWIIFRVVNDWTGPIAAITSILIFPISIIVMPIAMFFIPSSAAGPLALWPAIIFVGFLSWVANRQNGSLLLR